MGPQLELAGDPGELNGGMLVFVDGTEQPECVPWTGARPIDLEG